MTDATSPANGHTPEAESAHSVSPDRDDASGYGPAGEEEAPTAPDSGGASARPGWPGVVRPAGWFLSAPGEAAPPGVGTEPARTDAAPEWYEDPQPTSVHQVFRPWSWQSAPEPVAAVPAHTVAPGQMVGPTAALRGWPGGPGFAAAAETGRYDQAHRSGWQLAYDMWRESGIAWAPVVVETPPHGFAALPLGAPTMADAPAPTRPAPSARSRLAGPADPDELYRAWQGSVRQAARPRPTAHRRRAAAWQVVRVGVPAAVIVIVGAGAVMMLTGTTNAMLADRASQGNPGAFPGYPGQRGTVTVSSIASAGGTRLAVGSADGHPAIWSRAADGTWTLVSASSPDVYRRPGVENLTSAAYGPAGWIAVGDVVSGAAKQPVLVTSADGVTWHALGNLGDTAAFAGPGTYVTGVAASRNGYVVVGRQVSGGREFAAMWWSADLRNWVAGDNGGLDGRLKPSAAYAVVATAAGFIAVGTHGTCHTIWSSPDGRHWGAYDVPVPAGASSATLRLVAVNGTRAVAAGYAVTRAGDVPIVVASADGGRHWRQILLDAPGGLGAVTALTAAGGGFAAAGQAGPAGSQYAVTWRSPDGLSWSAATPAGGGVRQITALTAAGGTVTGVGQRGAVPSVVTVPAP
jgi:hypothetical protein